MTTDPKPQISICTTLLSRKDDPIHDFRVRASNQFFQRFGELNGTKRAELVVALWPCDNMKLTGWDREIRTTPMTGHFNVNSGHNASSKVARSNILFFCDTDLKLPLDAIDILLEKIKKGQCYFPIWQSKTEDKSKIIWRIHSFGNAGFHRTDFLRINQLSEEQAISWGGDIHIFKKAKKMPGLKVVRENWEGLWHRWHPKPSRNFYNAVDDKSKYS